MDTEIALRVNGTLYRLSVDPRTTVLDALRERLGLTGPKKGCDHGQCGACTILLDGRCVNSCLMLAVAHHTRATEEAYCLAHHVTVEGNERRLMLASLRYLDTFTKVDGSRLFAERQHYS